MDVSEEIKTTAKGKDEAEDMPTLPYEPPTKIRRVRKSKKTGDIMKKLNSHLENQRFYEAEQLYKTLYNRYRAQKQYEAAASLMASGATELLKQNQGNAGANLALLVIEVFSEAEYPLTTERAELVLRLFDMFPEDARADKTSFMKAAIKWSVKVGKNPHGSPTFHFEIAKHLCEGMKEGHVWKSVDDVGAVQRHFLRAQRPVQHAQVLIEWSQLGFQGELDLFIARCVLQYLCLQNLNGANTAFYEYTKFFSNLHSPLMNFIKFLLKTLERDATSLFQMLRQKYQPSINRDPSFAGWLDIIGKEFFDLEPVAQQGGLFGDLVSMLNT